MATRKDIKHFRELRRTLYITCLVHICTSYLKKMKGWTKSYFTLFLKLNDHPTRCFNFGLIRIHPNGCMFELNFLNSNLKQNPSRNENKYDEAFILALKFPVVTQFVDILTGQDREVSLVNKERKYLCSF